MEKSNPQVTVIKDATILPVKYRSDTFPWGLGGVLDAADNFVEASAMEIPARFGGGYKYKKSECKILSETIIFMGPLKTHWGHFLIDMGTRLWYIAQAPSSVKIAYCGFEHEKNQLPKECIEFFELLGIGSERLIDVRSPLKADTVIVPEQGFVANQYYYKEFAEIFNRTVKKANEKRICTYDKIYFTRTGLKERHEIGEELIEKVFKKSGFEIISPEKISVTEQIILISNCRIFASIEGTIAHNIIFGRNVQKQIILRKHGYYNCRQHLLNKMMGGELIYLNVSQRIFKRFPPDNYAGLFWLRVKKEMRLFCRENNFSLPSQFYMGVYDLKNLFFYLFMCATLYINKEKKKIREDCLFRVIKRKIMNYDNIVIYGAGKRGYDLYNKMKQRFNKKEIHIVDTNYKILQEHGKNVKSLYEVLPLKNKCFVIYIGSEMAKKEVYMQLVAAGVVEQAIFTYDKMRSGENSGY